MYNQKSLKAEDFISHHEIEATLQFADFNCRNRAMIEHILQKARQHNGLTHHEASLLLACELPDLNEQLFSLAEEIKQEYYGNRIVLFAPLYLSNYCVNGCTYCP